MQTWKIAALTSRELEIADIDLEPGPYCMSFGYDLTYLVHSIKKIGLLNTPVVCETESGRFMIVTGFLRILAFNAAMGKSKILCRIVAESQVSPLECLLINFYENLAVRKFNDVEKGMILSRMAKLLPKDEIINCYMPLLDLPSNESAFGFYVMLESEDKIKKYVANGSLSLKAAKMLFEMEPGGKGSISELIDNIKFNFNQQLHLIDLLNDISDINNSSISDILAEPLLKEIRFDTRLNNPQKARAILRALREKRFPTLVSAENAFKSCISRLNLPKGTSICAPPFFEAPDYRLEVLFRNGSDLRKKIARLSSLGEMKSLGDPWIRSGDEEV